MQTGVMMVSSMMLLMSLISLISLQMRQMICSSSQWQHLQRGDMPQVNSQPEALSATTSRGWLWTISQQMHERMDQGLTSPTLLGYAAEAEKLIDGAFPFKVLHDSYLWMEEQMRQLLAFMADEICNVMYYHQAMNQLTHGNLLGHWWKKLMGMLIMEIGRWHHAVKFQRDWNLFHLYGLCAGSKIWLLTR